MIPYPTADDLRTHGVYQHGSPADRLTARVRRADNGCWEWTGGRTTSGYGHFSIRSVYYQAHRLMYILHRGPVETTEIDHLCRNRGCVNPWHLEPVTHSENMRRSSRTTLNPDLVRAIRLDTKRMSYRKVAAKYGINHATVSRIMTGRLWADVDAAPAKGEEAA